MTDGTPGDEMNECSEVCVKALDSIVGRNTTEIEIVRDRLKAWEDEFRTNKARLAHHAEKHINFLKKELKRIEA